MAEVESFLFTGTAGNLEGYASGTIKVLLLSTNAVDNTNPTITNVTDIEADEIAGGSYARRTLTGVEWNLAGVWPGLKADNTTFTGIDVVDPLVVGAVVAYDEATGDLVSGIRFTPVPMSGDLPIQWPGGYIATLILGADLPDPTSADAGLFLTVDDDGNYTLGAAPGGEGATWGEWSDPLLPLTGTDGWIDGTSVGFEPLRWRLRSDGLAELGGSAAYYVAGDLAAPPLDVDGAGWSTVVDGLPAEIQPPGGFRFVHGMTIIPTDPATAVPAQPLVGENLAVVMGSDEASIVLLGGDYWVS